MVNWASVSRAFEKVDDFWNNNRLLAVVLLLLATSITVVETFNTPSPGVAIGFLALAAGIMSVRRNMHTAEQMLWVAVLVTLACVEMGAIKRSEESNEAKHKEQNDEFREIAKQITGSDTYLVFSPQFQLPRQEGLPVMLWNAVSTLGVHAVAEPAVWVAEGSVDEFSRFSKASNRTDFHFITKTHYEKVGDYYAPSKTEETHFGFVYASRGTYGRENLAIRFNNETSQWEFQYSVYGSNAESRTLENPHLLQAQPWTPIPIQTSMPN